MNQQFLHPIGWDNHVNSSFNNVAFANFAQQVWILDFESFPTIISYPPKTSKGIFILVDLGIPKKPFMYYQSQNNLSLAVTSMNASQSPAVMPPPISKPDEKATNVIEKKLPQRRSSLY